MGLKRRYKRFRYYCSWRYPRLFGIAQKLAFPFQVSVLCLALYSAVSLYQQRYSFEATMRTHQPKQANTVESSKPLALDSEIPLTAAIDDTLTGTEIPVNTVRVKRQTNSTDSAVIAIRQKNELPQINSSPTPVRLADKFELQSSEWVQKQKNDSFIIQLAASINEGELKKYARGLPLSGPLAMYPFKKTRGGKLMYGLSSGLYGSRSEALSALTTLPEGSGQYGSWVRKIVDVNLQITALSSNN